MLFDFGTSLFSKLIQINCSFTRPILPKAVERRYLEEIRLRVCEKASGMPCRSPDIVWRVHPVVTSPFRIIARN